MYPTVPTRARLIAAGWSVSAEHAASCYGMPVLVAPDGDAIGDCDLVYIHSDGTLCENVFEGRLVSGRTLRRVLEGASAQ